MAQYIEAQRLHHKLHWSNEGTCAGPGCYSETFSKVQRHIRAVDSAMLYSFLRLFRLNCTWNVI